MSAPNPQSASRLRRILRWSTEHGWPKTRLLLRTFPLKRCLLLVFALHLIGEYFPFSHFPMYSGISDNAYHFYLTDENDKPIPMLTAFGVRTAQASKIYRTRLRVVTDREGRDWWEATAEDEREAGNFVLESLFPRLVADQTHWMSEEVQLHRVDLLLEDGEFRRERRLISSLPAPALESQEGL